MVGSVMRWYLRKHILNSEHLISLVTENSEGLSIRMKPPSSFTNLLKQRGYSQKTVREIWKWYDFSERKGAANF